MNFVLLFVSNLLATTVASGARVEVQANGAINIASQGTLNVGASDSDLAAKVEELETWKTTMEAQMEHVMKTIAVITPPPSLPPPSSPPAMLSPPMPPICPWTEGNSGEAGVLVCFDGTRCTGWSCCNSHGGRAQCSSDHPHMCAEAGVAAEGKDVGCSTDCGSLGGLRPCAASFTSPCPWTEGNSGEAGVLVCFDGTRCTGWSCCNSHGGRAQCSSDHPHMCAEAGVAAEGKDFGCDTTCSSWGSVRPCTVQT